MWHRIGVRRGMRREVGGKSTVEQSMCAGVLVGTGGGLVWGGAEAKKHYRAVPTPTAASVRKEPKR